MIEVMARVQVRRLGVSERSLKVRRLLRGQEQAGALPAALTIFATRIPVSVRTSQAWLRRFNSAIASRFNFGLQALQRCSGLLNRRARGGTVATHHFEGDRQIEK